ncbi:MAG: prepilin-type N-terminal cleavage/methylation domain-containing protein [Deltaproteobacteria bacterium]|jgi:type IV pilus assembly protein PilA|nr:prepilin-type N-terminal cleavage/methylation domain-containing protein [Deltaproteobacteria bacterium]MBW2542850.1 prepilin-type N-terminal cleavage/methylation domain-containing protein [Deltaproteobacteria bacterium]
MRARSNSEAGFTLVELVIVVGIIGLLSAIAIPNFLSYQARSRRSEAYVNLAAVARLQNTYHAERGEFFEVGSWPDWVGLYGGDLSTRKMTWDAASEAAFGDLGWRPEGAVFYAYDSNTGATPCTCTNCFTATALGDVDDDDLESAVMYVHPETDNDGNVTGECPSGLLGFGTPVDRASGQPIYDTVAVQGSLDQY